MSRAQCRAFLRFLFVNFEELSTFAKQGGSLETHSKLPPFFYGTSSLPIYVPVDLIHSPGCCAAFRS